MSDLPSSSTSLGRAGTAWRAEVLTPVLLPLGVFVVAAVAVLHFGGFLLFHVVAELGSIFVGLMAVTVAFVSRGFTRNHFVVFISLGLGWCALLDFFHTMAYKGMPFAPDQEANVSVQLWIAARLLQAVTLLAAPAFLGGRLPTLAVSLAFAAYSVGSVALIHGGYYPDGYIEGQGLTTFKVAAEYLIIALLAAALVRLWRRRDALPPEVLAGVGAAIVAMMASEFFFTRYVQVTATENAIGHVLKVVAYWFIFVALVQTLLREPFRMLARTASSYDAVPQPAIVVGVSGAILQANRAASAMAGTPADALAGRASHAHFHGDEAADRCAVCVRLAAGEEAFVERVERGGRSYECHVAPFGAIGEERAHVELMHDITEAARLAAERASLAHHLGERVKELRCLHELAQLSRSPGLDVTRALAGAVDLLPPAFLHPSHARAQIFSDWGAHGTLDAAPAGRTLEHPLVVSGRKVGVVRVFYPGSAELAEPLFIPEEEPLLASFAAQLGELIGRIQSAERVKRMTQIYGMLSGTNRAMVHATSVDAFLGQIFGVITRHGTFPLVLVLRTEDGRLPLRVAHSWGVDEAARPGLAQRVREPATPFAQTLLAPDAGIVTYGTLPPAGESRDASPWIEYLREQDLRQFALLRLGAPGRAIGMFALYSRSRLGFEADEVHLLEEMATDIAFALETIAERDRKDTAERRASALESRFRSVFDHSPVPMMVVSRSRGEVQEFNRAIEQWLGYRHEEVGTLDRWFERVYEDPAFREEIRALWLAQVATAASGGESIASPPLALRRRDGTAVRAQGRMTISGDDVIIAWTELPSV